MKQLKIGDLNKHYAEGESVDKSIFSEMRSNYLLYTGEHHRKISERLLYRLRDSRVSETLKLKLVKNHIQVVVKNYVNGIVGQAPGVKVIPYNENERQDIKDAQLSQAVWEDGEEKQNIDEKIDKWALDFIAGGECFSKIYWDPNKGQFKGYKQAVNEDGDPIFQHPVLGDVNYAQDELGQPLQPKASDIPVFSGQLVIEPVHAFNLLRDPAAETMIDARWLCIRKMVSYADAKAFLSSLPQAEREDKEAHLRTAAETTFKVFDATKGDYSESKDQVMLREYYFRPCAEYPEGYYYIATDSCIFFDGPLPFGIFPIVGEGFDTIPTSPRSRSIIKVIKSCQFEVNRMASQRAMHQITFGDDKLITFNGSKLQKGAQWAGLREFSVPGDKAPVHLPGRAGDQFAVSLQEEVAELYRLANLEMELKEKQQQDTYAMLYSSLRQRKVYALYVKKFERFLCNVAKLYLRLAQRYLPDDYIVRAVGRREQVNIPEFRRVSEDGFNIKVKPMTNDIESMMGRSLETQQVLQYIGKDLPKHVQGILLKNMSFLGKDEGINHLTINLENVDSDILSLDRGEYPQTRKNDDHELYVQMLNHRMKQADYPFLSPQIQQSYEKKLQEHIDAQAQQAQELKAMQSEFIPTGGAMVTCSVHVPDPSKPGGSKQLRIPYEALMWLVKNMESQGSSLDQLHQMDQYNQSQVAQNFLGQQNQQQQQPGMGMNVGMQPPNPFAS